MKKYAVLLIVYKRYHNLEHLITTLTKSNIRIYAYVDIDDNSSKENLNAISLVKKYTDLGQIASHVNKRNLGAGSAIPKAIDWVFNHEDYVLVFEDDCELGDHALEYFENSINHLSDQVKIISGRSAYAETDKFRPINKLTLTNYSLTNGWLTSRESWQNISRRIESGVKFRLYLLTVLRNPVKTLPLSYFYAACLMNMGVKRFAWDCFVTFEMLAKNYYSVNPDLTCITTKGIDEFASNTIGASYHSRNHIALSSEFSPSSFLDTNRKYIKSNNTFIKKNIYNIKWYHLFSPIKSCFKTRRYRFRWLSIESEL
jgi:GR25 family glycosyltransferase involved in LPS biosynthesis